MENGEEDRISTSTDCLLIEILSRLPSTKDAVRTGTLSKRWQHLWASVSTLIFRAPPQCYQNPNLQSDFTLSVDKTLTQCRQLKLKKFLVHTFYDIRFESKFHNWIRYAISCKVEELNLDFWGTKTKFLLDQSVFINSCFTDLRLTSCKLGPPGAISWENLRSLCISRVNLDEELIVNIVSGCPLLETFVLESLEWPNINSEFESESESESNINGISAPTRLSLTECPQLKQLKKFKLCTGYDIHFQSQINKWIHYAIRSNVKDLKLRFWSMYYDDEFVLDQILFTGSCFTGLRLEGCMLNPIGAISWKSLRILCISDYQSLDEDMIENMLSGSRVLETLVLYHCYGYRRLDITSKSVKHLVLSGYEDPNGESEAAIIEVNAPNILSLTIQSNLVLGKLLLVNVSTSLVKASLNYTCPKMEQEAEQEMLRGYIMSLGHVNELEIGCLCSEVLSCLQAKGFVFPSNVKLTLVSELWGAALAWSWS